MRPASSPFYHCWRARLGPVSPAVLGPLSATERARLARFHTAGSRQAYAGAHLFLREVLSRYAGTPPTELILGVDAQQKPRLMTAKPLFFNLSYRAQWAVLAISNQGEVGVDVEEIKPVTGADALVEQLFSPAEQTALRHAAGDEWWALFYDVWTRKEAWATLPFAEFSVAAWTGIAVAWSPPSAGQLDGFALDAGHAAAVATGPTAAPKAIVWQHFEYSTLQPLAAFKFPQ